MIKHLLTFVWNRKKKNALLVIELAFAFLVLFGVFSFVIYNYNYYSTPAGFDTENRYIVRFNMPYGVDSTEVVEAKKELRRAIRSLDGVISTAFSFSAVPYSNSNWTSTEGDNGYEISSNLIFADEDYDEALNLQIREGRWIEESDQYEKYPAIVVTQQLREEVWGDSAVLGKIIIWGGKEREIVGVAEHYKYHGDFKEEPNVIFENFPNTTENDPAMFIHIAEGASGRLQEKIHNTIKETVKDWDFLVQDLDAQRRMDRKSSWIPIAGFIGISVFLIINVALGLFGVLLYNIKKRKAEIGLRRAIGASKESIFYQLIIEMMLIATLAIIIGMFFAIQVPVLELFPVELSIYTGAYIGSGLTIILLVLTCTLYPGTQALLVHPATALHEE